MTSALLVAALVTPLAFEDPIALDSVISAVTVYPGTATVTRRAEVPAGGGEFVLAGLPHTIDPDAVRVRCDGAEVVAVELRERFTRDVPESRVVELRDRVRELERAVIRIKDESDVLTKLEAHLDRLLRQEETAHTGEVAQGRASRSTWEENFAYLSEKLSEVRRESREVFWRIEDASRELTDAQLELGRYDSTGGVHVRDIVVDLVDISGAVASLEVDYIVGNAGWTPSYDLRTPSDLSKVELVYRAKVWQRSGEDWNDVDLALSTAHPQRGARAPELQPVWLDFEEEQRRRAVALHRLDELSSDLDAEGDFYGYQVGLLEVDEALASLRMPVFAGVEQHGISARFTLPRSETVESRDQPTSVLIGRAGLDVTPEHYCAPALDTTVWLRGRTTNTSGWALLPGLASVYFGGDFVGHADLPAVQDDEELTVHLGADPGFAVERVQLVDSTDGPGLFGSSETHERTWRIRVKNNNGFSRGEGAVSVVVQEVLPRSRDERIEVDVESVKPDLAQDPRWETDREERGLLTWILSVPKGGERTIELETSVSYPEDLRVVRR